MNHIDLELEILTPAFLAGADQHESELRAASIKGLLRWWWRASEGHRFRSPVELNEAEAAVFGSAEMKLKSPLQVGVELLSSPVVVIPRGKDAPTSSAEYSYQRRDRDGSVRTGMAQALHYLGYGPIRIPSGAEKAAAEQGRDPALLGPDRRAKRSAVFIRPAFAPGTRFRVRLAWRDGRLTGDQQEELVRACAGWVALGGLGCRSRKGLGSLHLVGVVGASSSELARRAAGVLTKRMHECHEAGGALPATLPKWPQLQCRRLLHCTAPKPSWEEALGASALEYRKLRPRLKDRERRFICGDVNPRRASSVLVSVHREGDEFMGILVALPCWKDERSEARPAWDSFLRSGM